MHWANGVVYDGLWSDDRMHGSAKVFNSKVEKNVRMNNNMIESQYD